MARKTVKSYPVKVKNSSRVILITFLIFILIGFLLRFDVIAGAVSKVTGIPEETLQNFGGHLVLGAIGFTLVYAGIVAFSVPLLGALLVIAGAALLIYEAVQIFNSMNPNKPIKGLKNFL